MYRVIGTRQTRAFRVLWMLEELGEPFEHVPAAPRSEKVIAFNPAGKVPVLIDDGMPITDSTAIIQYLADRHNALTHPAGSRARARQDSMTQFLLDEFDAVLWTAARHTFVLPEALRVSGIKDTLRWEFQNSQKTLEQRASDGPFLMGEEMTVPDIILTHCLIWANAARFPIEGDWLNEYQARMRARPAYRRTEER
ncbi:glutathione S-transferase family protein [Paracoccus sp. SCSIO 75233]|uniref:glutathione S-transferase family protein n=1 Tax=Paracoccus sp. SCSIO 75233 TaxID=3017782 RepID=UPI0022F08CCA|nr:glutathione S-transferase family protein [Paracoccus sp. SCSIO 75233]WBU53195.1 glutathione S-transferase family protein [Paracoccus sp. SCSIO 75233]